MSQSATPAPISVADLTALLFFPCDVVIAGRICRFEMRQLDLPTLMWDGVLKMTLLEAANQFAQLRDLYEANGGDDGGVAAELAVLEQMSDDDKSRMVSMLRRFACSAVMAPRLTLADPPEPDAFPVKNLAVDVLMTLFKAGQAGAPRAEAAAAEDFRAAESPAAGAAAPAGEDVRTAAEQLPGSPVAGELGE